MQVLLSSAATTTRFQEADHLGAFSGRVEVHQADGVVLARGQRPALLVPYRAVLRALQFAAAWKLSRLVLHLDSELIARQLTGQYRVKSPDLLPYYRQVVSLSAELDRFQVRHVRRAQNSLADALANLALDGKAAAFGAE